MYENVGRGREYKDQTRANNVDGVSRKRKTNVRPTVRRIGEKGEPKSQSPKSRQSTKSSQSSQSDWNIMQLGKSQTNTQWMFVRESSETLEEEEECGVEVACTLNAPKVSRKSSKSSNEATQQQLNDKKKGKTLLWSKSNGKEKK